MFFFNDIIFDLYLCDIVLSFCPQGIDGRFNGLIFRTFLLMFCILMLLFERELRFGINGPARTGVKPRSHRRPVWSIACVVFRRENPHFLPLVPEAQSGRKGLKGGSNRLPLCDPFARLLSFT